MAKRTVLTWVDLETTGLDEKNGRILEYAIVFTDLQLQEIICMENVLKQDVDEARALMDDYCREMHEGNGLLAAIEAAGPSSGATYEDTCKIVSAAICATIDSVERKVKEQFPEDDVIFVIAGSSISFDRRWLAAHMPLVANRLHYRQLDTSVYKVGFPEIFGEATSAAHRAMDDIRESIAKHQKMRDIVEASK